MLRCPVCGRVFKTMSGLVSHFKSRHMEKTACPCCGTRVQSLRGHAATHLTDPCHAILLVIISRRYSARRSPLRLTASRLAYTGLRLAPGD